MSFFLIFRCYKCDNEVDVEVSSVLGDSLVFLKKALGVKAAKQGMHCTLNLTSNF